MPAEDFSNLLWVLTLSRWMKLFSFDPVWTPKLLGLACAPATMAVLRDALIQSLKARPNSSMSGLENGLYALRCAARC